MPDPSPSPSPSPEALLRSLLTSGAITVETPFADRPGAMAAVTSVQLGGVLFVRVDPALRPDAPEWAQHQAAVVACLTPLAPLLRQLRMLKVPDFVGRWLPLPALVTTFAAGTRLHDVQHRWGWALGSVGVALLLRYGLRPLLVRAIRAKLRD
jgi:hypothetical protein